MAFIELKNVQRIYKADGVETPALRGVSFSAERGEFIAIMGPSGSGKSTLLHILGFLDHATSGEYYFDGKLANEYSKDEAAKIRNKRLGFVFQTFNLLRRTTVRENVVLPLLYSDIDESEWNARVEDAIAQVKMTHRIDYDSARLSGGEKQRVAIARALVGQPEVIFADEPTGNLDSKSGEAVMEALQELNKKGHTIFLVTHETYTAEHAARIIKIRDGMIESDGKVNNRRLANHFKK